MIAPTKQWDAFHSDAEKLQYMISHKLISPGSTFPKVLTYFGAYVKEPTPCVLVGIYGKNSCVIRIGESLHCIYADYLAEMQYGFASSSAPETYIVLDLETTGFSSHTDKIIEIAAVKYYRGIEQDTFETLVNPGRPIPPASTNVNGITTQDVQGAPKFTELLPDLLGFLGDLPIVAHNAPFDRAFLQAAVSSTGHDLINKWIDTLPLAKKAFPSAGCYKLEHLKDYLHISVDASHRALPDVTATAELYTACNQALRKAQITKNKIMEA